MDVDAAWCAQAMDVDDDGKISYTEFVAACWSWQEAELNVVWSSFCKMDVVSPSSPLLRVREVPDTPRRLRRAVPCGPSRRYIHLTRETFQRLLRKNR